MGAGFFSFLSIRRRQESREEFAVSDRFLDFAYLNAVGSVFLGVFGWPISLFFLFWLVFTTITKRSGLTMCSCVPR